MYANGVFLSAQQEEERLKYTIFNTLLDDSFKLGITVVVAAGNQGKFGVDISQRAPAGLAQPGYYPALIVVGSVNSKGAISPFTNKDKEGAITIYTNGEDIIAADYRSDNGWSIASGTSEATAQVAGLVAYFLGRSDLQERLQQGGLGQVAQNVKNYLISQGQRYTSGGPLIANNGELVAVQAEIQGSSCEFQQGSSQNARRVKRDGGFTLSTVAFTKEYDMVRDTRKTLDQRLTLR